MLNLSKLKKINYNKVSSHQPPTVEFELFNFLSCFNNKNV